MSTGATMPQDLIARLRLVYPETPYHRDFLHREAATALEAQAAEIARLQAERTELARWKSTHAPRLEALEGLLHAAQHEAHAGREAIATLAGERAANAMLTNKVAALRVDAERLDWLRDNLFEHKWNGVVGKGCAVQWQIAPDFRFKQRELTDTSGTLAGDFRRAIDAAREST